MEEKKNILTRAGLDKLEEELTNLETVKRKEIAEKIKEAREQGDLSENAEYDAAKDEQRVGSTEADSLNGKISNESPLGSALIGAAVGDIVDVEAPSGIMQYQILSIERNA